jgi:hypothetical protein
MVSNEGIIIRRPQKRHECLVPHTRSQWLGSYLNIRAQRSLCSPYFAIAVFTHSELLTMQRRMNQPSPDLSDPSLRLASRFGYPRFVLCDPFQLSFVPPDSPVQR